MEIKLTLALPRDVISVPVVRQLLKESMQVLGVHPDTIGDIQLALTEACTNVLEHATEVDEYEISAGIDGDQCVIEVIDKGSGFDPALVGAARDTDEGGRGVQLMRALVDRVAFTHREGGAGNVVHLEKDLLLTPDSVLHRLTGETTSGPWSDDEQLADAPQPDH